MDLKAFQSPLFELRVERQVAVLTFRKNVFDFLVKLDESEKLLAVFKAVEIDPDLKGLLFLNHPEAFSRAQYAAFIENTLSLRQGENTEGMKFTDKSARYRELNILNRFIMQAIRFKKVLAVGLQNEVVTPFFGAFLTADLRMGTPNLKFLLAHRRYNLHPSGALPYFLSALMPVSKAFALLLRDEISSHEALEMNILNSQQPIEGFSKACLNEVANVCEKNCNTLTSTKRLLNYKRRQELEAYFAYETEILNL